MGKANYWVAIGNAMHAYQATATGDNNGVQAVWDAQPRGMRAAIGRHIAANRGVEWCDGQVDPFNRFLAFIEELVAADRRLFPVPALTTTASAPISGGSPATKPARKAPTVKRDAAVDALIDGATDAFRAAVVGDRRYLGHERCHEIWEGLDHAARKAVIRWIDAGTDRVDLCQREEGRFSIYIACCAYGWELDARMPEPAPVPTPAPGPVEVAGRAATLATLRDGLARLRGAYRSWPCETTANLIGDYERAVAELETPPAPAAPKPPARGGQHAKPTTDPGDPIVGICRSRVLPPMTRRWPDAPRSANAGI